MIITGHYDIFSVAKSYFDKLYSGVDVDFDNIINHVLVYLSYDDNIPLFSPFSIDEFKIFLFQMDSNKSLGPNGLNPAFYKKKIGIFVSQIFLEQLHLDWKMDPFPFR